MTNPSANQDGEAEHEFTSTDSSHPRRLKLLSLEICTKRCLFIWEKVYGLLLLTGLKM